MSRKGKQPMSQRVCPHCGTMFASQVTLKNHLESIPAPIFEELPSEEFVLDCPTCSTRIFTSFAIWKFKNGDLTIVFKGQRLTPRQTQAQTKRPESK